MLAARLAVATRQCLIGRIEKEKSERFVGALMKAGDDPRKPGRIEIARPRIDADRERRVGATAAGEQRPQQRERKIVHRLEAEVFERLQRR